MYPDCHGPRRVKLCCTLDHGWEKKKFEVKSKMVCELVRLRGKRLKCEVETKASLIGMLGSVGYVLE